GLSSEIISFFIARDLRQIDAKPVSDGDEDITVYRIPLDPRAEQLERFLHTKRHAGVAVDYKVRPNEQCHPLSLPPRPTPTPPHPTPHTPPTPPSARPPSLPSCLLSPAVAVADLFLFFV